MRLPIRIFNEEAGYSLLEASVALTLFVAVIIPLGAFAMGLFTTNQIRNTITVHLIARDMMEETLALKKFVPLDTLYQQGKWRAVRSVITVDDLKLVNVRVTPANRAHPSAEFTTIRSR